MKNISSFKSGTFTERATLSPVNGDLFHNSEYDQFEIYDGANWNPVVNPIGPLVGLSVIELDVGMSPYNINNETDYTVIFNDDNIVANLPVGQEGLKFYALQFGIFSGNTLNTHAGDTFEDGTTSYDPVNGNAAWVFHDGVWYGTNFI